MQVIKLIEGTHSVDPYDSTLLSDHTSSVTLVLHPRGPLLIDTGGRGRINEVSEALQRHKLKISDIKFVILTHFHLDHAYNIAHFTDAEVIGWQHKWLYGQTRRIGPIKNFNELEDIRLVETPGHAEEHLSVIIKGKEHLTVVAGDAINKHYATNHEIAAYAYDKEKYLNSANFLLKLNFDRIICGHGEDIFRKDCLVPLP